MASLIYDDEQHRLGSPCIAGGTTSGAIDADAIAMDIANGNERSAGEWDATLDLMNEHIAAPVVHNGESGGGRYVLVE